MSDLSGSVLNENNKFVNKYGEPLKSQSERIKEGVTLLNRMKIFGIPTNDYGYIETKERLDEWMRGGDKWVGTIEFPRIGQKAELELPVKPGKEILMKLIAPKTRRRF